MHYDLIDTHISICSDKVPLDFSDNFDIENREDFIQRLLADDEVRLAWEFIIAFAYNLNLFL